MIRGPKYCRDHHSDLAAFTGHTVPKRSVGLVYKETIIIQIPFQLSDSEECRFTHWSGHNNQPVVITIYMRNVLPWEDIWVDFAQPIFTPNALNTALGVEQGFCPSLTLLHLQRHLVLWPRVVCYEVMLMHVNVMLRNLHN